MPGPFPQAWDAHALFDSFNRADEGPPPSSAWATGIFASPNGGLKVSGNTLVQVTQNTAGDAYRLDLFGPDQEAYYSCPASTVSENYHVYARLQDIGLLPGGTSNGYMAASTYQGGSTWWVRTFRMASGAFTQIGSTDIRSAQVTKIGIRCEGSNITAVFDEGSGLTLSSVALGVDTTYGGISQVGMRLAGSGAHVADDFAAGAIAATPITVPAEVPARHFGPF